MTDLRPNPYEMDTYNKRADTIPVSQEDFDALKEQVFKLSKTVEGIQQLLGKAAEYQGKPRGRLPR